MNVTTKVDDLPCISCGCCPSTHRTADGYPICDDCDEVLPL